MIPTLTGQTLSSVECDGTLDLSTSEGWFLTIENDYTVALPGSPTLRTDAGGEEAMVAVLTGAVETAIESFEIAVSASEDFEAWPMVGPEKERVVSTPGGQLALWL